jgi:hypothetical protein
MPGSKPSTLACAIFCPGPWHEGMRRVGKLLCLLCLFASLTLGWHKNQKEQHFPFSVAPAWRDAGSLRGSSCLGLFCLASAWGLEQPVAVHCDFLREAVSQGELFKLRGVQDSLCKNYISFVPALKTRGSHMDVESCCIIWCLSCLW